jgi:ParB family chromosome partitioning protein
LVELTKSIAERGILQNLTVVESEHSSGEKVYVAVIGNRRLAAAKHAGLTEVPCAVTDMDKPTQVGTMLLENMQRRDLTLIEECAGMQMMLDLGKTVYVKEDGED